MENFTQSNVSNELQTRNVSGGIYNDTAKSSFGYFAKYNISSLAKQFLENFTRYANNFQNSAQSSKTKQYTTKTNPGLPKQLRNTKPGTYKPKPSDFTSSSEEIFESTNIDPNSDLYHDLDTEVGQVIKEHSYGHLDDTTNNDNHGIHPGGVKKYIEGAINWHNIPKKEETKSRTFDSFYPPRLEKVRQPEVTQDKTRSKSLEQVTTEVTNEVTSDGRARAPG